MSDDRVRPSSGNVFADLGLEPAGEHKVKAELVHKLDRLLQSRRLSQAAAAVLVGVSQPDLSRLLNGRFRDLSVERLMRMLVRLDCAVDITVHYEGRSVGDTIHVPASA